MLPGCLAGVKAWLSMIPYGSEIGFHEKLYTP